MKPFATGNTLLTTVVQSNNGAQKVLYIVLSALLPPLYTPPSFSQKIEEGSAFRVQQNMHGSLYPSTTSTDLQ